MTVQTVFAVFVNSDTLEGRGYMKLHSLWNDRSDAIAFIDRQPTAHRTRRAVDAEAWDLWAIEERPVFLTQRDEEEWRGGEARKRALAKLTPEDRMLLGL